MKRIAVLTSGGDAPGMNACIRSVVLTALHFGYQVYGFRHGYNGLVDNEIELLTMQQVRHIIQKGGTLLKSARCSKFKTESGIKLAAKHLDAAEIDALIVIGGDGSLRGMMHLSKYWQGQLIGIPGTIDNDLSGSDNTIGFQTATETVIDAIDKLRDTADAFERIFMVEVMGRDAGFIALSSGIASGAEQIIYPEGLKDIHQELDCIIQHVESARKLHGRSSYIIVISENLWPGGAYDLSQVLTEQIGIECRPVILGHIQRGGCPNGFDRILATKLGVFAVEAIKNGHSLMMVGEISNELTLTAISDCVNNKKPVDKKLSDIQAKVFDSVEILSNCTKSTI
ncbi:ATP-dependent 6-phosphofructokinase [Saccharobesus litoralis]|uniref:6-phosphofructokinase n=1 Tax=Saccharobesus litoralis TaxID=2172099 RepID=A0A2S0VT09_9ALTE|nr:ATP-dependent 6-phosphofructokinase [Saccharobesus litoralis]AWB67351.1 ATP-dependent 6-phosphofructokinase [Saccharobesus litoralis]